MKQTIVSKVYNILKTKRIASLKEIYNLMPEHTESSIRGNINRHISKSENKLFIRIGKGLYSLCNLKENKSNNVVELKKKENKIYSIEKYLKSKVSVFCENTYENQIPKVVGLDFSSSDILNEESAYAVNDKFDYIEHKSQNTLRSLNVLSAAKLAGSNPKNERIEHDYYSTDPETVKLFFNEFHKENRLEGSILECACGDGNISRVVEDYYPDNEVVSTDLIYRGYGVGGIDFLKHKFKRTFDNIITNPPFKLMKYFVQKSLELANRFVIMFGKIQFLETKARKKLFKNSPLKYVYVHSTRQATWRDGEPFDEEGKKWNTTFCHAWFVWDKAYTGEPIIRWI